MRCIPARAMTTVPGPSVAPSDASITFSAHSPSSRLESAAVYPTGMCSTIASGTGKSAGSSASSFVTAWGPPVDAPSTTSRTVEPSTAAAAVGISASFSACPRSPAAGDFARAAILTFSTSSVETSNSCSVASAVGLWTSSMAPACSAAMARSLCSSLVLTTTHRGAPGLPCRACSTPTPSRLGIRRSNVITSGASSPIFSSASSPSRAKPTTSISASDDRTSRNTLRAKAESSTISTRIRGTVTSFPSDRRTNRRVPRTKKGYRSAAATRRRRPRAGRRRGALRPGSPRRAQP